MLFRSIELRKAGVTNATIKVLLDKKSPSIYPTAKGLFSQAKYPELIDLLRKHIAVNPTDYKSRSLLVLALVKEEDPEEAQRELHAMDRAPSMRQVLAISNR